MWGSGDGEKAKKERERIDVNNYKLNSNVRTANEPTTVLLDSVRIAWNVHCHVKTNRIMVKLPLITHLRAKYRNQIVQPYRERVAQDFPHPDTHKCCSNCEFSKIQFQATKNDIFVFRASSFAARRTCLNRCCSFACHCVYLAYLR